MGLRPSSDGESCTHRQCREEKTAPSDNNEQVIEENRFRGEIVTETRGLGDCLESVVVSDFSFGE